MDLSSGAGINVTNANAISLGDNADITVQSGASVRNTATGNGGLYGTGFNTIEFNSNGTLIVEAGAEIVKSGGFVNAEAVNVHGFGNRIENRGLIQTTGSAAIWFQDERWGARNVVDNYGVIEKVGGVGSVIGSGGGAGIQFYNRTGAEVIGGISFGGGNDDLFFFADSLVTGNINGGGGRNNLTLEGAAGSDDTLAGNIMNFTTLTKDGEGKWTVAGSLSGFTDVTVRQGTLALTGDNANYTGTALIETAGILEARAQSLPTQATAEANVDNVTNNGLVRFTQPDDGTYIGQITGAGVVEKTGAGVLTLAPASAEGNTYSGGTIITQGTVAVGADNALGASTGGVTFDGGILRFDQQFDLSADRAILLDVGGGTIDTQGFTTALTQGTAGAGSLTKTGSGVLNLKGDNAHAGGTTVAQGILALGGATGAAATLSGGGPVNVASGATLGGYGSVTGDVTNQGTITVADALAAFAGGPVGNLTINGNLTNSGLAQIGGSAVGNTLTVAGNYIGQQGTVGLNTFLDTDGSASDRLVIDGGAASGATSLAITNVGGPGAQTLANGILVVDAVNGGTTAPDAFALAGAVSAGAYDYFLFKGGVTPGSEESWFLRNTLVATQGGAALQPAPGTPPLPVLPTPDNPNPVQPPPPTPGATPATPVNGVIPLYRPEVPLYTVLPPVAFDIGLANLGTFHERRGEQSLLTGAEAFPGVWGRFFGEQSETSWSGTVDPSFDGSLFGFQFGLDLYGRETQDGHRDQAGVFVARSGMNGDIKGQAFGWNDVAVGDMTLNGTSLGAYWTHVGPSGWYLDGVVMANLFDGEATSDRGYGLDVDGSGFTASLEGGYPIPLGDNWTFEPQGQVIWQQVSLDDTQDAFSSVSFDTDGGLTGRVGARLQGTFDIEGGQVLQPYLKANLWQDFGGTDRVVFGGTDVIETDRGGTALELGAGLVLQLGDAVSFHATADYTTNLGGESHEAYSGNVGLSIRW
ncbi:autotransporter family protein [Devosia geojensis]|uniref:autotransporter family protein n=1 Tax=Devosia geojensis TaxID=443610 RepID=UPI00069622E8|nr:autotransporter outer membrane beta-barrel domain-containing protein [Devosia geojensis]